MSSKLCTPYKGDQPYLYISYCSEDKEIVLPILCFLQEEGYRIWYNDSSVPDSEWPDTAAHRLDRSTAFLSLISEKWIESRRCLDEFTFAQMKRMPSLNVILEPIQLAPAMKLQLVSVPVVDHRQSVTEAFRGKLLELLDKLAPALRQDSNTEQRSPTPPTKDSTGPLPKVQNSTVVPGPWRKLPLIIGIAAVLIIVVGIAATVLPHSSTEAPSNTPNLPTAPVDSVTAPAGSSAILSPSPESELDSSATYHIFLTAPADMSPEEFPEALSTLKERLNIFTAGKPYEITAEDRSIELYLPKSAFSGFDVKRILESYITGAVDLYISNLTVPSSTPEPLRRDDLASVTLSQGAIPGVDARQYGIDSSTYAYLTIQFTDQGAEWFGEEIAAWGDDLAFRQDIESVSDCCYYTFPAGDGKTFYILNTDFGGQFLETQVYNFTHSSLPCSFLFTIDLNSQIDWQTTEGGSRMGQNQCDPTALESATITLTLRNVPNQTAEEPLNIEKNLKARLDVLGQPYALGRMENEDSTLFAVKTSLEHVGPSIISLINGSSLRLRTNFCDFSPHSSWAFNWEETPDGTWTVVLNMDGYTADLLAKHTEETIEQNDSMLYLVVGDLPVLSAPIGPESSDGHVVFTRLCFGDSTEITEEYRWLTDLIEPIMNDSLPSPNLQLDQLQMNLEDGSIGYYKDYFGISYAKAEQSFCDAVHAVSPDAVVIVPDDLNLDNVYVYLNLPVNDELPERATAQAQEIYEVSEFEKSIFQKLTIYLTDEANGSAHIDFNKYNIIQFGRGCIYVSGAFGFGDLNQYRDAFRHIVKTDPFYVRLTADGLTFWF